MALRRHRHLALVLLLVVAVGLAAWRLGLEVLWFGSLVFLETAVHHPWLSTLVLVSLSALSFVCSAGLRSGRPRGILILNRALVWLVSIISGVLLFQAASAGVIVSFVTGPDVYDWGRLREPFLEHPLLGGLSLFLLGLLWFMVLRLEPRRVANLVTRVVVFLGCVTAWMFFAELAWVGIVSLGVEGWKSLDAYAPLAGGVLLGILCALGVKWVFRLQAPRWAIALATFAAVLIVIFQNALQFLPFG